MAQTHHPFDKLFKTSFKDINDIKDLIVTYFDAEIIEGLRFDTLKIIPNELLNADFQKKNSRYFVLLSLQTQGEIT